MQNPSKKQRDYVLDNGLEFSSNFQSGNLSNVIQKDNLTFQLSIQADPASTYRTWFYFSVKGIPQGATATFCIRNMSNQVKLFKEGHLPVFRSEEEPNWTRIRIPIQQNGIVKGEEGFQLTFKHTFGSKSRHEFAFSYPWTYSENNAFIKELVAENHGKYWCQYRPLCKSSKQVDLHLLTVTKISGKVELGVKQFKEMPEFTARVSPQKKGIFVSARVHPGEVASSHILNGFIKSLFSKTAEAQLLLQKCIFYIVPMINPDGVMDGNFRCDSLGRNLNRFYTAPTKQEYPQIFAVKSFVVEMIRQKLVHFCLDLHAHVNKQGCFAYGNSTPSLKDQVAVCLFPKLLQYNCRFFDYQSCNFSEKNMTSKDRADDLSKQGASRVAFYKETGLVSCWTLQCNYNSCRLVNDLPKELQDQGISKTVSHSILLNVNEPNKKEEVYYLNIRDFWQIGRDIATTLLDYYRLRNVSRYNNTPLKNIINLKLNLAVQALRMIPFRFDNQCRKLQINLNSKQNLNQTFSKILERLNEEPFPQYMSSKESREKEKSKSKEVRMQSIKTISNKSLSLKEKGEKAYSEKIVVLTPNIPKIPRQK